MLYMPVDLFGAYTQGREYAIDRNWNDLNQSNNVEQGWLNNDAQQLKNWFTTDTYGDNLTKSNSGARVAQDTAMLSGLDVQNKQVAQPGTLATTQLMADYQQALAGASRPNIPTLATNQATYQLGQSVDAAALGGVRQQFAPQMRTLSAQADLQTLNNNNQTLQAQADLLPLQTEVGKQNLQAQERALTAYQNGTLLPQQPIPGTTLPVAPINALQPGTAPLMPAAPVAAQQVNPVAIWNMAGRISPGQTTMVDGVPVSRDETGLFILNNGVKQYVPAPAINPTQQNAQFFWGK